MDLRKIKNGLLRIALKFKVFKYAYIKKNNKINISKKSKVFLNIKGKNNIIYTSPNSVIKHGVITISGNNCVIKIGDNCSFVDISLCCDDDGSKIIIGNKCRFCGKADISCIEGHTISIGDDLLVSKNVSIVNGDSHSIVDCSGKRINWSKDITIGNHVWIGKNVNILKNGSIGSNIAVGANSLVIKDYSKLYNVVIAGSPARVIKENVNWDNLRIPEDNK